VSRRRRGWVVVGLAVVLVRGNGQVWLAQMMLNDAGVVECSRVELADQEYVVLLVPLCLRDRS